MKIKSIASSSSGNCHIVESGGKQIILDCGVPLKKIRQVLDFDLSNVVACLISHEHGDHAKYLPELEKNTVIPIWCDLGTKERWGLNTNLIYTSMKTGLEVGNDDFVFYIAKMYHDCKCHGFVISANDEKLFYATDTKHAPYLIQGLKYLMIEANYSFEKLVESEHNKSLIKRICETHLSIDDVVKFIKRHPDLEEIHLLHLSDAHSDAKLFKKMVQEISGAVVYVAGK